MLKKLLATILSVSTILSACNLPAFAWAPTNFRDPKCIDIRQLGVTTNYVTKDKKTCGCRTCSVDVLTYDKLGDYIKELSQRFDDLLHAELYLENNIKKRNIELVLKSISRDIEHKTYKNMNFLLVSTNYDTRSPWATTFFATKDGINYGENQYDEKYFDEINNKFVKPLLNEVEKVNGATKGKLIEFKDADRALKRVLLVAPLIVFGPAAIFYAADTIAIRRNAKKHAAKLKKLISLLPKMTKAQKNSCLKKMNEYLEVPAELTAENLEKLPTEAIDELLKDIEK